MGQENHTAGHPFRFGLLVDGRFSWISDPQWEKHIGYSEDTFASHVTIRNQGLRISLMCYDVVDFHEDLFLRLVERHDDRSVTNAKVIGTDPDSEVALIKREGSDFRVLPLGDSDKMDVGDWVVAVGNPLGLSETVIVGVASAVGRSNVHITA